MLMRLTLSVIKADVGSVGGHTKPSARMMASVEGEVAKAIGDGLLVDGFVCHTGDDIAIIMTHTRGVKGTPRYINSPGTSPFLEATSVAKTSGSTAPARDLLCRCTFRKPSRRWPGRRRTQLRPQPLGCETRGVLHGFRR
jgi:fructose 1,6-bisphosphate aldolase/phosphatase